jgi:sugar O-acyltransferase (sialic acid O-acetyltransferase NeuD family)
MDKKPIVIVGTALLAEQVHFYFAERSGRRVEAFAVDAEYLREASFCGKPVLEFEEALSRYPPATHELFVAIGFLATEARKRKYDLARALGYTLPSYVHPSAWVAENVHVGANTLIQEQAVVAPFVRLGEDVFLCPQVGINHHTRVGAHCFFAPAAVVAGDAEIGELCFIGTNATIRDRVHIGVGCVIGAGAVIMSDCAARGVYPAARTECRS